MAKDFVVIGLGTFGFEVAKQLFKQGHNVMAIDKNAITIHNIQDHVTIAINTDISDTAVIDELELYNYNKIILGLGSNLEALILTIAYLKNRALNTLFLRPTPNFKNKFYLKWEPMK
jgi:trk system potassium uptake protein TrkA